MSRSEILSFAEFTESVPLAGTNLTIPRYDNFPWYFKKTETDTLSKTRRQQPHFKKFLREHPDLESKLRDGIWGNDE